VERRRLGDSGLEVAEIGLGCMGMSAVYEPGTKDDDDSVEVIRRAIDLGVTLFDTSDVYGPYANEKLLGRAIADRRDEVVVATKAGCVFRPNTYVPAPDARPARLKACCDESLDRLGVDVIDLWQLHRPDPAVPIEESVGAMAEMVAAGKVRAIGVSEVSIAQLDAAHRTHPLAGVQYELSLWSRAVLDAVLPWCVAHQVALLPYSPLGRGFLTGGIGPDRIFAPDDARAANPRFSPEALRANQPIVDAVRAVARRLGATVAQVALAWVLAQGDSVVPIPGPDRIEQLEEDLGAANVVLDGEALAALDALPAASDGKGH
jgi:aryl-alcohol dehydrogenase-like predicted oxidoreductase